MKLITNKHGFTLIELLVTVLIIVILAALIFPLGKGAIQKARSMKCISNLRVLGQALHAYIADNNGRFPPSRTRVGNDGNGNALAQDYWIYSAYFGDKSGKSNNFSGGLHPINFFDTKAPSPSEMNKKGKTYKDAGIFWCPADNDPEKRPLNFAAQSYGVNGYYIGGKDAFPFDGVTGKPQKYVLSHSRLSAVLKPSEIIFAVEFYASNNFTKSGIVSSSSWPLKKGSTNPPSSADTNRIAFDRHGGFANAVFLDGSVKQLTFDLLAGTEAKYLDPELQYKEQ